MKQNNNNNDVNKNIKRGFISRLPFGVKATFIKYWFYGALYFFCFMGLGLTGIPNENLVLVTGLIGGVLFDIALYNIFLLFAETREEASKWWIFKSKKVYSILINIVVIVGLLFAFYYIIVPIKSSMPKDSPFSWLFQEPLSAALLLTILDTALCWIKNGSIILFKKIFKLGDEAKAKESLIKILDVSPVSVTIEVNSGGNYFANKPYNVLLNNEIILKKVNTNILTIYDLKPDTQYKLAINRSNTTFTTSKISRFYKAFEGNDLQGLIDDAEQYSLIVVNKGTYKIKSLSFKNNIIVYFRKGVTLLPSNDYNDYPIISPYYQNNKNEIYGVYHEEPHKIRQAILNIDHLSNVRIIGEPLIDGSNLDSLNETKSDKYVLLPYLMLINHSTNISIVGLTIKNSLEYGVHSFFSNNIDLLDLNISSSKEVGALIQCSSNINIIGGTLSNNKNAISVKSGNVDIANLMHTPSKDINIRNILIENSEDAISIGNNIASGISNINISHLCVNKIKSTFHIKTNLNMGKECIIKDININDIDINDVLTPFIINAYDNYDNKIVKVDNGVPYLDNFIFSNIKVKDYEICAGVFYGINKRYIDEIRFINCSFIAKENAKEDYPLILKDIEKCSKAGFIVNNARTFALEHVSFLNLNGDRINVNNVGEIIDK